MAAHKKAFCVAGHIRNYDKYGNCVKCCAIRTAVYREKNKEKVRAQTKKWVSENREMVRASQKSWIASHPEYKAKHKIVADRWHLKNIDKARALHRGRESSRRQRRVCFGQEGIRDLYMKCPSGFHVDHKIPLHGKQVSGLHVIWNLQYLPAADNLRKSNKVEGFYEKTFNG